MKRKIINEVFIERCNLLKEKNVPLDVIESEIGVSKGSLSKYLNGIHLPNSEVVRKLAKYWNVSSDYLLGSSDSRNIGFSDGNMIPNGFLKIVQEAISLGISEDEFREIFEMAKKFKNLSK